MAANNKTTILTLYIERDGDFSGAHVVGGTADVFSRILAAHVGQHQAVVHHFVSPRQRRPQLGPGDCRGWESLKGKVVIKDFILKCQFFYKLLVWMVLHSLVQ